MFHTILIANRGEIACRVIRTARELGIRTVAVYSDADAAALHVDMADEAYRIGPAPARNSYLDGKAILDAARRSGAQAIHPGYGFLSENAAFAEACAAAGVIFIGPPPDAIRAMGGKSESKALMDAAGVPLVPGYHGEDQDPKTLRAAADHIGYPVLIKASAGGGGKGMKVVSAPEQFDDQLASARREAAASFGDDRVLVEKYLTRPRHIEIQVFADTQGGCVYLFERDCSIQRRHQKVVEEAPAPGLDPQTRRRMGEAAVAAARAIGYVGAGTVEFLLDEDGRFYFMEMNTRLQVEHPVTEMITGQDLVQWQLEVAAGRPLPVAQEDLRITGHAIEVRLYAEDPFRDFLPSTGRLDHVGFPAGGRHVRVDAGVRTGDAISIHYDPMMAKLIVWDRDRIQAIGRLSKALAETQVAGVATNIPFLGAVAAHPAFAAGDLDTRFIERYAADLLHEPDHLPEEVPHLAALAVLLGRAAEAAIAARASEDPFGPWNMRNGWRLNDEAHESILLRIAGVDHEIPVIYRRDGFEFRTASGWKRANGRLGVDGLLVADLEGVRMKATVIRQGDAITLFHRGQRYRLTVVETLAGIVEEDAAGGRVVAPMPGKVISVLVDQGVRVTKGQALMVLEAMKMEHTVVAPRDGTIASLRYGAGDQVEEGVDLVRFGDGD